ncbi:MAG: hypothetical protein JO206_06620 [Solirubrobacterales bacterium]|nr:hypothetical protein [Solirubrobacterales bacterium]MBV9472625.1 hypothetical protein [Solirubrobacterales bacterium]MBV9838023.1 hypothetical protein [Solirubrobacterales bacterium]
MRAAVARFVSLESANSATASPATTSRITVAMIAIGIRQSGARWMIVRAVPHSTHHS